MLETTAAATTVEEEYDQDLEDDDDLDIDEDLLDDSVMEDFERRDTDDFHFDGFTYTDDDFLVSSLGTIK